MAEQAAEQIFFFHKQKKFNIDIFVEQMPKKPKLQIINHFHIELYFFSIEIKKLRLIFLLNIIP